MDHTQSGQTERGGGQLSSVNPTSVISPSTEADSKEPKEKSNENGPRNVDEDDGTDWKDDEFGFEIDPHDLFKHFHHLPGWEEFFERWCEKNKDNPAFVIYSAPATSEAASPRAASPSRDSEHPTSTRPAAEAPNRKDVQEEGKGLQGGDDANNFLNRKRRFEDPVGQARPKRSRSCTYTSSQQPTQQDAHRHEVIKTKGGTEEQVATNKSSPPSSKPLPKEVPLLTLPGESSIPPAAASNNSP